MDKLLAHFAQHFDQGDMPSLYEDENGVCRYNYVIGSLYIYIRKAVLDGADTVVLTPKFFTWLQGDTILDRKRIDKWKPTVSHCSQFHKMLQHDTVLRQHVQIISDTPEEVVFRFVQPD